jgi:hypothetical protein
MIQCRPQIIPILFVLPNAGGCGPVGRTVDHLLLFVVFFSGSLFFFFHFQTNEPTRRMDQNAHIPPSMAAGVLLLLLLCLFCFSFIHKGAGPRCWAVMQSQNWHSLYKHTTPLVLCRKSGTAVAIKK